MAPGAISLGLLIDPWVQFWNGNFQSLFVNCICGSYDNALRWMLWDLTDGRSKSVQVMAWCHQATSHYLSQCCHRMESLGHKDWTQMASGKCGRVFKKCNLWTYVMDKANIDGLMQERCNSSALAMELHLSCINPSICKLLSGECRKTMRS